MFHYLHWIYFMSFLSLSHFIYIYIFDYLHFCTSFYLDPNYFMYLCIFPISIHLILFLSFLSLGDYFTYTSIFLYLYRIYSVSSLSQSRLIYFHIFTSIHFILFTHSLSLSPTWLISVSLTVSIEFVLHIFYTYLARFIFASISISMQVTPCTSRYVSPSFVHLVSFLLSPLNTDQFIVNHYSRCRLKKRRSILKNIFIRS